MENPFSILFEQLLLSMVEQGNKYFVRQSFVHPLTYEQGTPGKVFLITNYKNKQNAEAHMQAIQNDRYAYLYDWNIDKQKLLIAASQPAGYKIYSSVLRNGQQYKINTIAQKCVKRYVESSLRWARGGETIQCNIFIKYGEVCASLRWKRQELCVRLQDIQTS